MRDEVVLRDLPCRKLRSAARRPSTNGRSGFARQTLLIRELFADFTRKNPVTDAEVQAEYDKYKASPAALNTARSHILVEKEDEAKALIARSRAAPSSRIAEEELEGSGFRRERRRPRLRRPQRLRARVRRPWSSWKKGR